MLGRLAALTSRRPRALRLLSTHAGGGAGAGAAPTVAAGGKKVAARPPPLALKKKQKQKAKRAPAEGEHSRRVCAYLMGSTHSADELIAALGAIPGLGPARRLSIVGDGASAAASSEGGGAADARGEEGVVESVVQLSAPTGTMSGAHAFFLTTAGGALPDGPADSCVCVWWGADPQVEQGLLRDLLATQTARPFPSRAKGRSGLSAAQVLARLAVPREEVRYQLGSVSEVLPGQDELIRIDGAQPPSHRVLDELAVSHALGRHMRLALVEDEVERMIASMKVIRAIRNSPRRARSS